jgi:cell division protein FtsX
VVAAAANIHRHRRTTGASFGRSIWRNRTAVITVTVITVTLGTLVILAADCDRWAAAEEAAVAVEG